MTKTGMLSAVIYAAQSDAHGQSKAAGECQAADEDDEDPDNVVMCHPTLVRYHSFPPEPKSPRLPQSNPALCISQSNRWG
eukprot:CAMPEP_0202727914 /NCGR_PEP_ID=MMETSP1385-20130828/185360_1 /ASSEMBLY_ACC=CAM_ASM_000861 /TAXON_ID=933848 /ORGANISM="Elphidium margaritaceum" /LENGTH=79 /DNA_ID=CAMNT_0049394157 /DNA_START=1234 /DNA_END=1473 /DNA_ORIENTATION=+